MKKRKTIKAMLLTTVATIGIGFGAAAYVNGADALTLSASADPTNGNMKLTWDINNSINYNYRVYKQKTDGGYELISTVDVTKLVQPIKVLNVYPSQNIPNVTFTYTNGSVVTLPKSAALKVWMEGGSMNQDGTVTNFDAVGIDPASGRKIIDVTPVTATQFNSNPNMVWQYDMVMFGTWDCNGIEADQPNSNALNVLRSYLDSGYGIVAGHDTLGFSYNYGLNELRNYFAIDVGSWGGTGAKTANVDYNVKWGYRSTQATVVQEDVITGYPWNLPVGTKLSIPETHTCANAARGVVPMQLTGGAEYDASTAISNYTSLGGKGNAYYYVTRNNNAVMIQTGHSNCNSTSDERKVLANALVYLKQLTDETNSVDTRVEDKAAPALVEATNISKTGTTGTISVTDLDNGSPYTYYVEAISKLNGAKTTSPTTSGSFATGVKGYSYVVDNNATTDVDSTIDITSKDNIPFTIGNGPKTYIHIRAIDNAGNVGPVNHILLHENVPPTLTLSQNPTKWTNQDVTITAVGADEDGTVVSILKADGTTANASSTTQVVSQNGTYAFTATDNSGAPVTESIDITNIDKVKPDGTYTITQPNAQNRYAQINFNATDDASGVAKIVKPDGSEVTTANTTYRVTVPGTYTFVVHDVAGNSKEIPVEVQINSDGVEVKYVDVLNNNEEISTKVTKTGLIGDSFTSSSKDITGYELVARPESETVTLTMDKQTLVYEYKKLSDVYTRAIDLNSLAELQNIKTSTVKQADPYTTTAPSFDGYQLVTTPENANGTMLREDITATYGYKKISAGVDIRYVDDITGELLEDVTHLDGLEKDPYESEAKDFDGYLLEVTATNPTGVMTVEKTTVEYRYRKVSKVYVKYLDMNLPDGENFITGMETRTYKEGYDYNTTARNLSGYVLMNDPDNKVGTMGREDITVTYLYKKVAGGVVIRYIDDVTGNNLLANIQKFGNENDEYTSAPIDIEGYELEVTPTNANGKLTVAPIYVDYRYRLLSDVTVKHVDLNQKAPNNNIVDPTTNTYKEGYDYTSAALDNDAYQLITTPENANGTMGRDNITLVYEYKKKSAGVDIKYVDDKTGELLEEVTHLNGLEKDPYESSAKTFEGYELEVTATNPTGLMTVEKTTVEYRYRKLSDVYTKAVDANSGEVLQNVKTSTVKEGYDYETQAPAFDGYVLIETPSNAKGTMGRENVTPVYMYKKISNGVLVNYVDRMTGTLIDSATFEGNENDEITIEKKTFDGYTFESMTAPESLKVTLTVEPQTYTLYYKLGVVQKVIYKDLSTGEILDQEDLTGIEGDSYHCESKDFEGYDLVSNVTEIDGIFNRGNQPEVFTYRKHAGSVVISYVDIDTNEVLKTEQKAGYVGEKYESKELTFKHYDFVEVKGEPVGTLPNGGTETVTYYYKKQNGMAQIIYVDEEGHTLLKEILEGRIDDEFEFKLKEIENYRIVEKPEALDGAFTDEVQILTVKMEKIPGTIEVILKDNEGNVMGAIFGDGYVGEDFEFVAPEKEGYKIVGSNIIKAYYVDGHLEFEVVYEKIPETGDMNILAMLITMIASVFGITKISKKTRKDNK